MTLLQGCNLRQLIAFFQQLFADRGFVWLTANVILVDCMHGIANSALAWIGFCIFIVIMLAIDLGVFNRRPHEIGYKNASLWSAVWVTLAGIFAALLFGPLG